MGASEPPDLDAAIDALAAALAPRLVLAMSEEAVAEVRAELAGRLTAELLRRCKVELDVGETARGAVAHYMYGVVRSGTSIPRDLPGVDPSAPVRMLECRGLAALISDVPLADFDEAGLRGKVDDVAWLEATERAHEHVLGTVLGATAVVPQRICTVLLDEGQVHDLLSRDYGVLLDALERLSGRSEWSVKAFAAPISIEREAVRRAGRTEAGWHEEAPAAGEWAWEIHTDLALFADEALCNPLQPTTTGGRHREMLLNGVYLVDDEQASDFRSVARELTERLGRRGVEFDLSGPGPAYNFVKSSIEAAR